MNDDLPPTTGKWFPKRDRSGRIIGWVEMLVSDDGALEAGRYVKATAPMRDRAHERKDVIHGARH
jgi:hypothetical protein